MGKYVGNLPNYALAPSMQGYGTRRDQQPHKREKETTRDIEAMRTLYQIDTERQDGQLHPVKTWLVLARTEDEARMLIRSHTIARVADCGECAAGESRIVGWMGEAYEVA